MVLWVDKYRPRALDKLELHDGVNKQLKKLVAAGDFPHVLFYGPSGAGKKTRIMALLRELFGASVEKVKVTAKQFKVKKKLVEISTLVSNHHIELNPSDVGTNDRLVVQEVIKEIAQTQNVATSAFKGAALTGGAAAAGAAEAKQLPFKVVVLNEVDRLSRDAQHALRRTMEKYMTQCRLVLCCESVSRVIGPLRSRCLPVRVAAPTVPDIVKVLQFVATKENLKLPVEFATRIAIDSNRNLRKAILMLEACKVEHYPFAAEQKPRVSDWERFIDDLARAIVEEQSPPRLQLARDKLYELLTNCIPPDVIIKTLTNLLLRRVDNQLKHDVARWAAHYEHRMCLGTKPIFHLEAFVAKFMALYKRWTTEAFGAMM